MYQLEMFDSIPSHQLFSTIFNCSSWQPFYYSLQVSDSASESIQIDATRAKTPKVREDTNQATRRGTVHLNIVEDDENLTSEPCCAPTSQQFCTRQVWVLHDIEATIRARKCRSPRRIIKWIVHLIFWLIAGLFWLGAISFIGGLIGGFLFGIGYLLYLGTAVSVFWGMFGVILVLFGLCWVDLTFDCGVCEYLTDTSDTAESKIRKI